MEDDLKKRGCDPCGASCPAVGDAVGIALSGDEAKQKELHPSCQWECPVCGARIWSTNKQRHLRTKKHGDAKYVLMDKFEVS
jgi:hypothetical protein